MLRPRRGHRDALAFAQASAGGGAKSCFLVRKKDSCKFVVSVIYKGRCDHYMVSFTDGQWQHKKTVRTDDRTPFPSTTLNMWRKFIFKFIFYMQHKKTISTVPTGVPTGRTSVRLPSTTPSMWRKFGFTRSPGNVHVGPSHGENDRAAHTGPSST